MNRQYVDISHFRAPYKNWMSLTGLGATAQEMLDTEPSGVKVLKAEYRVVIEQKSETARVLVIGGDDDVQLVDPQPGDIRETGVSWIKRKLAEKKTVLAGAGLQGGGVVGLTIPGVPIYLKAVAAKDEVWTTKDGIYGVLARPASLIRAAIFGPIGIAVAVLAGAGLLYVVFAKKKRHATANPRRRMSKKQRAQLRRLRAWGESYRR